jgi:hypothetical protein
MVRVTDELAALEDRYGREAFRDLSFPEALARFSAFWVEARALRSDLGTDWLEDLAPDLAIARAVNGLPPAA